MYPKKTKVTEKPKPKPTTPMGNSFSNKNIAPRVHVRTSPVKKTIQTFHNRPGSRSIQQYDNEDTHLTKSDMRSQELFRNIRRQIVQNEQDDHELFGKSNRKIGAIKELFGTNKIIEIELAQVLKLIKEEKNKIYETISDLKNVSDYYKTLCDVKLREKLDIGVNTEDILESGLPVQTTSKSIQTQNFEPELKEVEEIYEPQAQPEIPASPEEEKQLMEISIQTDAEPVEEQERKKSFDLFSKESEVYSRLALMLSDMNINYKKVLPDHASVDLPMNVNWKDLSESEIIKIQKYFIKKLAQKVEN